MAAKASSEPIQGPNGQTLACHCRSVFWQSLEELVVSEGMRDIDALSRQTMCCTGCGCCRWDIEPWLANRLAELGESPDSAATQPADHQGDSQDVDPRKNFPGHRR